MSHPGGLSHSQSSLVALPWILRLLACFQLLLMGCTWPLWLNSRHFPAVPLWSLPPMPEQLPAIISGLFSLACLLLIFRTTRSTSDVRSSSATAVWLPSLILFTGLLLGCFNQHCLQAWHVFFLWAVASCLIRNSRYQLKALRQLPACVYVCSGLSRLSMQPEAGPTGMILGQLTKFLPVDLQPQEADFRWLCHAAAWGELSVGLLLLTRGPARWIGIVAAMLLHVALLAALGPMGLNHSPAVLLWNVSFLLLLPLLFRESVQKPVAIASPASASQRGRGTVMWAAWSCLLWCTSLGGLVGLTDNWSSWQLYSPRPEQWQLWIDRLYAGRVPYPFAAAVSGASVDGLVAVRLDVASLRQTGSPLYPEDRFQLALIRRILAGLPRHVRFRVRIDEPEGWRWWRRRVREVVDHESLTREPTGN